MHAHLPGGYWSAPNIAARGITGTAHEQREKGYDGLPHLHTPPSPPDRWPGQPCTLSPSPGERGACGLLFGDSPPWRDRFPERVAPACVPAPGKRSLLSACFSFFFFFYIHGCTDFASSGQDCVRLKTPLGQHHSARSSSIFHKGRSPSVASLATEHPGSDRRVQEPTRI
ncbi:hypothetical protein ISCGN_018161 [Ixodes scapularis]